MATELTKYQLVSNSNNNNNFATDFRGNFSLVKTKNTSAFVYGVVFVFIAVTVFLAFSPSSSSSSSSSSSTSAWFINIFTANNTSQPIQSLRSPLSSSNLTQLNSSRSQHTTIIPEIPTNQITTNLSNQDDNFDLTGANNDTFLPQISTETSSNQVENFQPNNTESEIIVPQNSPKISPASSSVDDVANLKPNNTINPEKQGNLGSEVLPKSSQPSGNATFETVNSSGQEGNGGVSDFTVSLSESNSGNDSVSREDKKQGKSSLVGCDLYDGDWVRDDSYPLYKPGSCKFIDEQFNCKRNGRPDDDYQKFKWKPKGCTLPRLNGRKILKLLRGKRLVLVGDSLNRNMWESLICILRNSVKNPKNVYEGNGRHYFRNEGSYSFVFKDYNCTIEFFVAPFLVRPSEVKDKNGTTKETLRLDLMVEQSEHFKNAEIIVFNTGHWWTHEKTSKGEDYYQEGSNVYKQLGVKDAFEKALTTWGRWVDNNINPERTQVFFRGYSNTHFHGGQWNYGGQCDSETEPIRNETYLTRYPWKMKVLEKVMNGMKVPISYLNITRMTDYRKDAHPSIYRKQKVYGEERKSPLKFQDCSHWCLPGVPDLWNELLYAEMLRNRYQR